MSLISLAIKCGITTQTLQDLIAGVVTPGVSAQLGVTTHSLQEFINGGTSIGLAVRLGMTSASLQELRLQIGKQGAIGLIIGALSADKQTN